MFQRTRKSTPSAEPPAHTAVGHTAGLLVEHVHAWRDAATEVRSTYRAWCTAGRRDSHRLYLVYLDALRYEELTARQVERDAHVSAVGTTRRARAD